MYASPHTHAVRIQHKVAGSFYDGTTQSSYPHYVQYGDTRVRLSYGWEDVSGWSSEEMERRLDAAIVKAVKRHDEGSRRAGERKAREARERQAYQERLAKLDAVIDRRNSALLVSESRTEKYGYPVTPYIVRVERHDTWGLAVLQGGKKD